VASKKLFRRLLGLGAVSLVDQGLGDDQHPSGYEASLDRWLPLLWTRLRAVAPLPQGVDQASVCVCLTNTEPTFSHPSLRP